MGTTGGLNNSRDVPRATGVRPGARRSPGLVYNSVPAPCAVRSPHPESMIDRAARLERIRVLLDERRHPERRIGIFSATNLTRLVLRLVLMGVVGGLAQRVLPSGPIGVTLTALAIGAADMAFGTVWARVQAQVHRGFQAGTSVLVVVLLLGTLVALLGPNSGIARGLRGQAATSSRSRTRPRPEEPGPRHRGGPRPGVRRRLATPDHRLTPGEGHVPRGRGLVPRTGPRLGPARRLGNLPTLSSWPTLERPVSVWAAGRERHPDRGRPAALGGLERRLSRHRGEGGAVRAGRALRCSASPSST